MSVGSKAIGAFPVPRTVRRETRQWDLILDAAGNPSLFYFAKGKAVLGKGLAIGCLVNMTLT